jgi:hypothetical protein
MNDTYRSDGVLYRPVAVMPWSELTEGSHYALPGDYAVRVRTPSGWSHTLWGGYPALSRALLHRSVLLLEPVD